MEGELETAAAVAPEPIPTSEPEPQDETVNLNGLVEGEQPDTALAPVDLPEDEFEEFEWNGKPIKAPKGLKDGVLMHADYTRKTQEVAATRKELDERAARIEQQASAGEEELQLRGQLYGLKTELDQYENVDWNQWMEEDIVGANKGWMRYTQLQQTAGKALGELQTRMNRRSEEVQQATARRLQETREYAEKNIKGWSIDVDTKVTEFATKTLGFDVDTLKSAYNPQVYQALYLAHIGHQLLTKQSAPKPSGQPAVPLTVVGSKANPPARKSLADMDMDEYVAFREKQEAAKRR